MLVACEGGSSFFEKVMKKKSIGKDWYNRCRATLRADILIHCRFGSLWENQ
jgi:hypothetical protein